MDRDLSYIKILKGVAINSEKQRKGEAEVREKDWGVEGQKGEGEEE